MLIYKEELPLNNGIEIINLPYKNVEEARENILHLETQYGIPCMWFNVIEEENKEFELVTIGTGHNWCDWLKREEYIGSLVVAEGIFVWHYFLLEKGTIKERMSKNNEDRV